MSHDFTRDIESASGPTELAEEALEHFRRARRTCGDSPEEIATDEKKVSRKVRRGKLPSIVMAAVEAEAT